MKYIHVRNLQRFQDGYKERRHYWAKIFLDMIVGNSRAEMLNEIDFSRLVKLIVMESCTREPQLMTEEYLTRKGFNFKDRSLALSLENLSHFIEVIDVTEIEKAPWPREEKSREEKKREDIALSRKFDKPDLKVLEDAFTQGGLGTAAAKSEAFKFLNYYESVGWVVGSSRKPMKSWRGAVATWAQKRQGDSVGAPKPTKRETKPDPSCNTCDGTGFTPEKEKCWCWGLR